MNDDVQTFKDDIAFMRALTEDSGPAMARDGMVLAAAGTIFGLTTLLYWLMFAGVLDIPGARDWLWVVASALFVAMMAMISRREPLRRAAASRATRAAWVGVGSGIVVAGAALGLSAWRLDLPVLGVGVFPLVLFTLYGAAWGVAFAVVRRRWLALVAVGCFAAVVACGWLMGTPEEWLLLSVGLFVLVAMPGVVMVRQSRGD
jgi:hypothetical protein